MNYRAMVLTPTLVGDGNRLAPIDYMVWRDQVNVLDQTRIFRLLSRGPKLDGYLTQLRKATKLDFASWGGFAQNFADRRIPFEDPSCTPQWNAASPDSLFIPTFAAAPGGAFLPGAAIKGALRTSYVYTRLKPQAVKDLSEKLSKGDRLPRRVAEQIESQTVGQGGSDRMRAVAIADSAARPYEQFRIYMCRVASLIAGKQQGQYSVGWKQTAFAEMATPGTVFEGTWRENAFLNREEVRKALHWSQPVNHKTLFDAANQHAAKQLEIHANYAKTAGLSDLGSTISELQARLDHAKQSGSCLISVGWGAGFLSKSAAIGADDAEHRKLLGQLPFYRSAIRTGMPFPKTRLVVQMGNRPAALPGWLELRVD